MKVNISGTISKDKRADSGLDEIGDKLHTNRLQRMVVVGIVEFHAYHDVAGKPETLAIRFAAIEPLTGEADHTARTLLDGARRARGVGSTELTLFDQTDDDGHKGPWPGDVDYIGPGTTTTDGEALETLEAALLDKASEAAETAELTFRSGSDPGDDGEGQGGAGAEPELQPDADTGTKDQAEAAAEVPVKPKRAPRVKRGALASVPG